RSSTRRPGSIRSSFFVEDTFVVLDGESGHVIEEPPMPTDKHHHDLPQKNVRGRPVIPERDSNLDRLSGEPGAHPVGTGVGATGGALAGATIGAVGGPVGIAAGALAGAVTGGIVGKEVAERIDPTVGGRPEQPRVSTGGGSEGAVSGA